MTLRLEQEWDPTTAEHGGFRFALFNLGDHPIAPTRFCYSSMTRLRDDAVVSPGTVGTKFANHVEIALPSDCQIEPGKALIFTLDGLTHAPTNRTQGAMAAWVVDEHSATMVAQVGDLAMPQGRARGPIKDWPAGTAPDVGILPWPAEYAWDDVGPATALYPADGTDPAPFALVASLHRRLFPAAPQPFTMRPDGREVRTEWAEGAAGSYKIRFGEHIVVSHADADGLRHALITLAQVAHHALIDDRFGFPLVGHIADGPRFDWRGCHLDVARNFRPACDILRILDILAWHKMNRFHWHLSDDEGYRLPSVAFPALNTVGATRGGDAPLPPQYADGPGGQSGRYTRAEVNDIVAHAGTLGIDIVPEIDLPGHVTAILAAIPDLADPEETPDSYRSIQGYPNNALNPALDRTYEVVETLLDEVCEMFPGAMLHIGGDEVDHHSWSASPAAQALAKQIGATDAMGLQSHFLRKVQQLIRSRERAMGGWDECALGGGIDPEDTVLMAWQTVQTTARLISDGYDVVATPGQAYYLDMVQGSGWDAAGTSWAGPVPPEVTYAFEPSADMPNGPGRLLGVQAGIWTEHIDSVTRFNDMVFPRLSAVAESGWTSPEAKDWQRFCALSRLMPTL